MAATLFLDDGSTDLQGPVEGGTAVTAIDEGATFTDTSCDDDFAGVVIDGAKWTDSATGSGSVSQDDEILLRTGTTANSSAVLTSVPSFEEVGSYQVRFEIQENVVAAPPIGETRFFDFELFVDASNYLRVSRVFDPNVTGDGHAFRITAVVAGTTVDEVTVLNNTRLATVRLVRVLGRVIVSMNSTVIYDDNPFVPVADAQVIFRAVNPDATNPFDFTTTLDDFVAAPMVLFSAEPGIARRMEDTLVRMESPAVSLPTTVPIEIHNCSGLVQRFADAFEYFLSFEFRVLSAAGTTIGIVNDRTLRNIEGGRLGFEI